MKPQISESPARLSALLPGLPVHNGTRRRHGRTDRVEQPCTGRPEARLDLAAAKSGLPSQEQRRVTFRDLAPIHGVGRLLMGFEPR